MSFPQFERIQVSDAAPRGTALVLDLDDLSRPPRTIFKPVRRVWCPYFGMLRDEYEPVMEWPTVRTLIIHPDDLSRALGR